MRGPYCPVGRDAMLWYVNIADDDNPRDRFSPRCTQHQIPAPLTSPPLAFSFPGATPHLECSFHDAYAPLGLDGALEGGVSLEAHDHLVLLMDRGREVQGVEERGVRRVEGRGVRGVEGRRVRGSEGKGEGDDGCCGTHNCM